MKNKRITLLFLIFCMLLSLVGCDESSFSVPVPSINSNVETEEFVTTGPKETEYLETVQGNMQVHFLDVGQGDAAFVELADGNTMLIDAGNTENGDEIVSYIRGLQHEDIDFVVATHPHEDHIGGMSAVLSAFKIGRMYMPRKEHTSKTFENMLNAIEKNGVILYTAKSGTQILTKENLKIEILSPQADTYSDLNNFSAVIKITYGDSTFLFTGDVEAEVETALLGSNIDADVLKVGHHGSDTSSSEAFIKAVSPEFAIISCGKGNSYGHPHDETLAVLQKYNTEIYRTDEVGTVIFTADNTGNIQADKKASVIKENAPPVLGSTVDTNAKEETDAIAAPIPTKEPVVTAVPTPVSEQSEANASIDAVVYRTRTGEKYHRAGCSYLKSKIETTVNEAKTMGLTPCKRCAPPA